MFTFFKVKGESMSPLANDGDFVFGLKHFMPKPESGHIVIFKHPIYGRCIKRILKIEESNIWLEGANQNNSLSTEQIGPIAPYEITHHVLRIFKKN